LNFSTRRFLEAPRFYGVPRIFRYGGRKGVLLISSAEGVAAAVEPSALESLNQDEKAG
jgi:hypothetical protein